MLSKEEIESMKIGLWNIRADNLKAMQCSLADTSDKKEWQKEINVIDNALEYIDQLESDKQKLIEKLEKDTVNITKTMQDGKHCDDYSRCRLKAYRTKTKEILSILKGENHE